MRPAPRLPEHAALNVGRSSKQVRNFLIRSWHRGVMIQGVNLALPLAAAPKSENAHNRDGRPTRAAGLFTFTRLLPARPVGGYLQVGQVALRQALEIRDSVPERDSGQQRSGNGQYPDATCESTGSFTICPSPCLYPQWHPRPFPFLPRS